MTTDAPRPDLLEVLQQLLDHSPLNFDEALNHASTAVAAALRADKVDAMLYAAESDTLVARGTSDTPMGHRQHALGLDRQPLSNGGKATEVFKTGEPFFTGHADREPGELPGMPGALGIRSEILVPLTIGPDRSGVLLASSAQENYFSQDDLAFLQAVSRWLGLVTHRSELTDQLAAEAAARARRQTAEEITTVLSHDLRNHLSPIQANLKLLLRRLGNADFDAEPYAVLAEAAARSVDRMERLLAELLDIARIEGGLFEIEPEATDLASLVDDVCALARSPESPISVTLPERPLLVWADAARMRQALENLVSNAVQHSEPGAPVEVRVFPGEDPNAPRAMVTIYNRGAGIPEEVRPRLFTRFGRGPGSTGLGLGLYLAKRIVDAHHGQLAAASLPGEGVIFSLSLPEHLTTAARKGR